MLLDWGVKRERRLKPVRHSAVRLIFKSANATSRRTIAEIQSPSRVRVPVIANSARPLFILIPWHNVHFRVSLIEIPDTVETTQPTCSCPLWNPGRQSTAPRLIRTQHQSTFQGRMKIKMLESYPFPDFLSSTLRFNRCPSVAQ